MNKHVEATLTKHYTGEVKLAQEVEEYQEWVAMTGPSRPTWLGLLLWLNPGLPCTAFGPVEHAWGSLLTEGAPLVCCSCGWTPEEIAAEKKRLECPCKGAFSYEDHASCEW